MREFEHPEAIRHFQSICDACQELTNRYHNQSELRLYTDGYLHALRKCGKLSRRDQEKLEALLERWILDPSSFISPGSDLSSIFLDKNEKI
tara:strand:+ start:123 stop:395 length:273 start_codon:yes stop_codon:yes gene_type:complete